MEIQRPIRFIGVNIFRIDEPAESVHKVLKIIGYTLLPHCTEVTDLEVVAAVQVAEIQRADIEAENIVCLISPLCLGNTSSHLLCYQYQPAVMDLDRTNRIFYQHVILNEKRVKDYQEQDSLIHNNEFFKSDRTLDR